MSDRTLPQRELRNNVSAVLRAVEAGETFTVTVHGRPVARVVPPGEVGQPRVNVEGATVRRIRASPIDDGVGEALDAAEASLDDQGASDR